MSNKKYYVNNIWNKKDFRWCIAGKKLKIPEI